MNFFKKETSKGTLYVVIGTGSTLNCNLGMLQGYNALATMKERKTFKATFYSNIEQFKEWDKIQLSDLPKYLQTSFENNKNGL
jgi:hypothetical protein